MVTRYQDKYDGNKTVPYATGWLVAYKDYLALQVALREALDEWALLQSSVNCHLGRGGITLPIGAIEDHIPRIAALRKFLDDK